jgi:hypothetical protein
VAQCCRGRREALVAERQAQASLCSRACRKAQSGFFDMFATENRLLCIRSIERVGTRNFGSVYESHGIPGMIKLKQ